MSDEVIEEAAVEKIEPATAQVSLEAAELHNILKCIDITIRSSQQEAIKTAVDLFPTAVKLKKALQSLNDKV